MSTDFWKFDTAGNTTLFLGKRIEAVKALHAVPAEQAGFFGIDPPELVMAGGEFCANASLAFGALLRFLGSSSTCPRICGQHVTVDVSGTVPYWKVTGVFQVPEYFWEDTEEAQICHLAGISHALIKGEEWPDAQESLVKAVDMRARLNLDRAQAAGVVWWQKNGQNFRLMPVVSVPGLGTCNLEGACGSASIALALAHGPGSYSLKQPSGEIIYIELAGEKLTLSARVTLQAQGQIWL